MQPRALLRISFAASLIAGAGAFGCAVAQDEESAGAADQVVAAGDVSALLKSTLILDGGCTAAKVGPKHLLVSARCVTGNTAFASGKVLKLTSAATGTALAAEPLATAAPADAGAGASKNDAGKDSGAKDAGRTSSTSRDTTIAEIKIHPSYAAKCKDAVCGFNTLESGDAPDVAIILLENELATVPSIPVDLDPVGVADSLLVVASGCKTLDAKAAAAPRTIKTLAVPAKTVSHAGSAYEKSPQLVSRLDSSYVVTAGVGWRSTDTQLCKADLGAPLFRGGSASVAGIVANYTTYAAGNQPVTIHHTRVDGTSRFKIGAWLEGLGVETMHSCSETAGGCVKRTYDGGAPMGPTGDTAGDGTTAPGDGGKGDAIAPDASASDDGGESTTTPAAPSGPHSDQLPTEDPSATGGDLGASEDYADAAAPRKKKKAAASGCSAAPGTGAPAGEMFVGFGLAIGAMVVRRRKKE
jgi:hypothetical protein